jgi:hypothetical protein
MKFHTIELRVSVLILLMVLGGCAPFVQYRTDYDLCVNPTSELSPDCENHAIQEFPAADGARYLLSFIEFDDQGQLWHRKQMWSVIDKLSTEAASKDLLITVFVHGWKHSAARDDGNIETFRKVLAGLSENELLISKNTGRPARQVAGIYLGWRGGSITTPVVEELTFWDRKNTAQKVSRGGVTEVLGRLELLKRVKENVSEGKSATRLVIVGHSFGGAVVHSSLVQILENRFVRTMGQVGVQSDVEGFGNLVVLINPAFEALQFASLSDMSTERGTYFKSQLPVMAILTSEADGALRNAFPIGRHLSTFFEKDRDIRRTNAVTRQEEIIHEGEANVTAIGRFPPYETHRLYPSGDLPKGIARQSSSSESVDSALAAKSAWEDDKPGSRIPIAGLTMERSNISAGRNPYLVIGVDKNLITDHNHINDGRIIEFIKQLILISTLASE